ncbi:hypothetical protein VB264_06685 [Arcicella aquatica]|uniref:Uncharacterized protein n=1 Tax=Arcicella aquatica TaxID=217141 RepID=A0ABU5QK69_9BACT|nr:hypothetical protein [Arcicella aquatica]MEA5257460.1 hypothetical protein [Arcicella aquatica]
MNNVNTLTCFVIMPFSVRKQDLEKYYYDNEHWNEVYNGFITPAIREAKLKVLRDDDDYSSRLVGIGIWSKIEKSDIILCDISAHNPNVHLELGWAMRADKKIVFIKDDLTEFNFDLNQYYTYEYSHRLQPSALKEAITNLSKIITATLTDNTSNYSIVNKLTLQTKANEASLNGNIEVGLLQELLNEVRTMKRLSNTSSYSENSSISLSIQSKSELPEKLIGSTWRKKEGLEEIYFTAQDQFMYTSVGTQKWIQNNVIFDSDYKVMKLYWRHDDFVARCTFDSIYSSFSEQDGTKWFLVAIAPFIHPSFRN